MSDDLTRLSARALTGMIATGALSAREALHSHWDRIDRVNPAINAIIYEDRDRAFAEATAADERQASGAVLPPLHGLPMTHKDTNDVAGMPTTWGSPLLAGSVPAANDVVIERLRAAGVVSTGKSNVPEFAAGAHTFNDLFGTTHNPYDLSRSAGGSSGGVAAALAAGIQPLGDGSDMGGSVRIPAAFCNVVGLRPSRGRIPIVTPNSWAWLARAGLMAREVADVALAMSVVSGPDARSPLSLAEDQASFAAPLERDLRGLRIGWTVDFGLDLPVEPEVVSVFLAALGEFEQLGLHIEEAAPDLSDADFVFNQTRAFDFELGWGDLVRGDPARVKPEMLWNVGLGTRQTGADIRELALARTRLEGRIREYFSRFDLLLTPGSQCLPFPGEWRYPGSIDGQKFDTYLDWMRSASVISAADVPALAMPAGFTPSGLPVGLQLVAPHGADLLLLQVGHAFEQRTRFFERAPELA